MEKMRISLFHRRRRRAPRLNRVRWKIQPKRVFSLRFSQFFQSYFWRFLIATSLLFIMLYSTFFTTLFTIEKIQVFTSYKDINAKTIADFLEPSAVGKNLIFIALEGLQNQAAEKFPEVAQFNCERNFSERHVVCEAIGYELVAIIRQGGDRFYLNENGFLVEYDARKLGLPIFEILFRESSQKTFEVGDKILESSELKKILDLVLKLEKTKKISVAKYIQVASELRVTIMEPRQTMLFDLKGNIDEQLKKLQVLEKNLDLKSVNQIDLRIEGEKVFYL